MAADYESKASYSNKIHYFKYLSSYDSNEKLFKGISSLKFIIVYFYYYFH